MNHTKWMVCAFLSLILITLSILNAADEAVIQDLASDVTLTKSEADKKAQEINSLKGGLPALEERVAVLEAALPDISQLQADLAAAQADIVQLRSELTTAQFNISQLRIALANEQAARIAAVNNLQGRIGQNPGIR